MKELFSKKFLIHFGECDPQGILYFARVSEMAHEMLEEFVAGTSLGWKGWFRSAEFAVPLKNVNVDFSAPMRAGEWVTARLIVAETGDSSVVFQSEFYIGGGSDGEKLAAVVKTVHVFVSQSEFKKIAIPASVKAIL